MTDDSTVQDLKAENAILRGALWLTVRSLKNYHDAPHFEHDDDGIPKLEVIVPESFREKAAESLERAERLLQAEGRSRTP